MAAAAVKIQSAYRSHLVRAQFKTISAVHSQSTRLIRLIQRQETVDAVRNDPRERIRVSEALMGLLLTLDGVPGWVDPAVRDLRRRVSRRIVEMQEVVDAVAEFRMDGWDGVCVWVWEEEELCATNVGDDMRRFCARHLGFPCLQRFLYDH